MSASETELELDVENDLKIHNPIPSNILKTQYDHIRGGRLKRRKTESMNLPNIHNKYIFGNYDSYYGYRTLESDGRIKELEKIRNHLEGSHWLDVGCNNGQLTSLLGEKFKAKSVTGVDIDQRLINRAIQINKKKCIEVPGDYEKYFPQKCSELVKVSKEVPRLSFHTVNISNLRDNIPLPDGNLFDIIMAFSVSKWIHLNFGDSGLRLAFSRISSLLNIGGLFILEAQPWKSYKKAVSKLGHAMTSRNLKIHPSEFGTLLESQFGFEEYLTMKLDKNDGFTGRDIIIYKKVK